MTSMNLEKANVTLLNEELRQENDGLKLMLSLVKENKDLKIKAQGSISDATKELEGKMTSTHIEDSLDESKFKKDLQQRHSKSVRKTSSPVNFESFIKTSMHTTDTGVEPGQSCMSQKAKEDSERIVGEIAFQLDRRILFHVFKGQRRLYGFTLLNIQDKITQVSTHPLSGKVDEGYRLLLFQRYSDVMERLRELGYNMALHPPFTEFVINTYGILTQRPARYTAQEMIFNNADFLRKTIIDTVPGKMIEDLFLLLSCLSYMAKKDGKPLFHW